MTSGIISIVSHILTNDVVDNDDIIAADSVGGDDSNDGDYGNDTDDCICNNIDDGSDGRCSGDGGGDNVNDDGNASYDSKWSMLLVMVVKVVTTVNMSLILIGMMVFKSSEYHLFKTKAWLYSW